MQGPRKKSGGAAGQSIGEANARGAIKDPGAARMLRMGEALGNDELKRRIDQGNASRDELLAHLAHRLGAMREAQVREANFGNDKMRTAWKDISDIHKEDVTKPDPTRYHEAAKLYEMAAYQLCRGALGRGAQIVEQAMEAERKAFEGAGSQIGLKDLEPESDGPAVMEEIQPAQACAPTDLPAEIEKLADEVQRDETQFKDLPNKTRARDPWWTLEEEEEEEGAPGDAG